VEFEPNEEFEWELRQALQRRPAPPRLKSKLMERRRARGSKPISVIWQRLAASIVLVAALAGGVAWRNREEQRKDEAARQQVLTALRITAHALNQMNAQLAAHSHVPQE
jgi:hypothetical protein